MEAGFIMKYVAKATNALSNTFVRILVNFIVLSPNIDYPANVREYYFNLTTLRSITQDLWIEQQTESVQPRYPFQEPLKQELQHFVDCIIDKKKPLVTGEDGVRALEVATAAMKSSAKNRAIQLKR